MPMQRAFALLLALALPLGATAQLVAPSPAQASGHVWINEIHYDNAGTDTGEAIEVAGAAGTDLSGWSLVLYNGSGGAVYDTRVLSGIIPDQPAASGFGTLSFSYPLNGIQNGSPDGIALVNGTTVVQFLSYEGSFTGVGGAADGMGSTDIGVFEPTSSPVGDSLQLSGAGATYAEFDWIAADATFGQPNQGQSFVVGLVVADCGPGVETPEGTAASTTVSASDSDGVVTSITIDAVEPSPGPGSITITSFTPASSAGGSAEATVTVDQNVPDGTYTVTVTAGNGDTPPQTDTCSLTVRVFIATEIAEIQGVGHLSPLQDQPVFGVQGMVTAIRLEDDDPVGGFWMHDPTPDGNLLTSDGIFVYTGVTPDVAIGDLVRVDGTVTEFRPFFEEPTITEIEDASWTTESSGNPLLPVITVGVDVFPPTVVIDNDSTGNIEVGGTYDPAEDGIDFWETLEGMRVAVDAAFAVGPTNNFGEVAVVSQAQEGTGEYTARGGLIVRNLSGTGNYQPGDFNPERLIIDDEFVDPPALNVGDEFAADPVGVMHFGFGAYKLLLTEAVAGVDNGLQREVTEPAGAHELAVATFNVENLSAQDSDAKVAGLASQVVNNLRSPDLIAIEEMQDNSGFDDDGTTAADLSWQRLIDAIVDAGGPLYDYRQIDPLDNVDGGAPGGNIRVGFLFHSERGLEFVDRPGGDADSDTGVEPTPNGKAAQLTISPGRVLDAELGGGEAFFNTRKSLAGEFRFRGETIFVVANHFSSKGDDNPLYSQFQPPTRWTEFQSDDRFGDEDGWRHAQGQAVNDFVDEILAVDDDAHVIVLGDINDFDFSETIGVLTGELVAVAGGPDGDGSGPTAPGGAAVLGTLFDLLLPDERYSYVFEGNSQVLDQILVSSSLLALDPSYDVVHVNAEFADQASDHDPSVMRVAFQPRRGER